MRVLDLSGALTVQSMHGHGRMKTGAYILVVAYGFENGVALGPQRLQTLLALCLWLLALGRRASNCGQLKAQGQAQPEASHRVDFEKSTAML